MDASLKDYTTHNKDFLSKYVPEEFFQNYDSFTSILFMNDSLYKCIFYASLKDNTKMKSSYMCHVRLYTDFLHHIS